MRYKKACITLSLASILVVLPAFCRTQDEPQLTPEQQRQFLLSAKVIRSKQLAQGVTNSFQLTLSDGVITHDAHFQSIEERKAFKQLERGGEINFADSYLYILAAYELAGLLGLADMVPVAVGRKWEGKAGAMAWWVPTLMTEGKRQEKKIRPPDPETFNRAIYKVQVFTELIYDTDRWNPGNILIGKNWEVYMVDFTRAFRLYHTLQRPEKMARCSRELLEKLRALDGQVLAATVRNHLTELERTGIMKRRDKIVAHLDKLIAEKGEGAVLY